MARTILFLCNVLSDGIGDYYHYRDYARFIRNHQKFKGDRFFTLLECEEAYNERLQKMEAADGAVTFYNTNRSHYTDLYRHWPELYKVIAVVDLIITLSYPLSNQRELLMQAPFYSASICIDEHEAHRFSDTGQNQSDYKISRPMGLGESRYGIKLRRVRGMRPETALASMSDNPIKCIFENKAIGLSLNNTLVAPAYFHSESVLKNFVLFLACNVHLKEKHILLYCSSAEYDFSKDAIKQLYTGYDLHSQEWLKQAGVKGFGFHSPKQHESSFDEINPDGHRRIEVVYGTWLSDKDYDLLYQMATIVGVCGDNTFERTISFGKLPYYVPRHAYLKSPSINALFTLCKNTFTPGDLLDGFEFLFTNNLFQHFQHGRYSRGETLAKLPTLDLIAMKDAWYRVRNELFANWNTYDKMVEWLEQILSRKTQAAIDSARQIIRITSSAARTMADPLHRLSSEMICEAAMRRKDVLEATQSNQEAELAVAEIYSQYDERITEAVVDTIARQQPQQPIELVGAKRTSTSLGMFDTAAHKAEKRQHLGNSLTRTSLDPMFDDADTAPLGPSLTI